MRQYRTKLTQEQQDEIYTKHITNGLSPNQLATEYGVDHSTIRSFLKHKGIIITETKRFRPSPLSSTISNDDDLKMVKLYTEDKLNISEISSMFKVSTNAVKHRLIQNNIQIRTLAETKKIYFEKVKQSKSI